MSRSARLRALYRAARQEAADPNSDLSALRRRLDCMREAETEDETQAGLMARWLANNDAEKTWWLLVKLYDCRSLAQYRMEQGR